jgi:hypothetical protein
MNKPILCLDFDGVIHSYTSGWKGAAIIPDPPVEGAIAFMLGALHHFHVVIFSSRSNQPGGESAMRSWLRMHAGAAWHETPAGPGLEDIEFVDEKPAAFITLDDRAITFNGTWPTIAELQAFKPWNKRGAFTRARLKTELWDIWQYTDAATPRPLWVLDCTVLKDGNLHMRVEGLAGRRLETGDWLVRDGSLYGPSHETDEKFRRTFELVP